MSLAVHIKKLNYDSLESVADAVMKGLIIDRSKPHGRLELITAECAIKEVLGTDEYVQLVYDRINRRINLREARDQEQAMVEDQLMQWIEEAVKDFDLEKTK